jgi:hypothetical protein
MGKEKLELTDAPPSETRPIGTRVNINSSYNEAVQEWKTVRDVNVWVAENFHYDLDRAMRLADNSKTREETFIYTPVELFNLKKGSCIDLSRFAFETISSIDPSIEVKYLMIEFEPLHIGKILLRRHWMVVYKENGQFYTIADTKYPGYIDGPYENIDDFIAEYQKKRKREIVGYKVLDTYAKRLKSKKIMKEEK